MRVAEKITFGTDVRRALSGADLYVRIFQITSVLPILYIFAATSYPPILISRGFFSAVFDLGMSAIPRWEALALSSLYRATSNEIFVYFALLFIAFFAGILGNRLFRDNHKNGDVTRKGTIVLLGADLILRLLPLSFNMAFGLPAAVCGFAVRAVCLCLAAMDLRKAKALENERSSEC